MSELRARAMTAARKILGDTIYDAMTSSNTTGPIELLRLAAHEAFIYRLKGEHIEDLRQALLQLDRDGVL